MNGHLKLLTGGQSAFDGIHLVWIMNLMMKKHLIGALSEDYLGLSRDIGPKTREAMAEAWDPATRSAVQKIPLLSTKCGPRDKEEWQNKRLKEVRNPIFGESCCWFLILNGGLVSLFFFFVEKLHSRERI